MYVCMYICIHIYIDIYRYITYIFLLGRMLEMFILQNASAQLPPVSSGQAKALERLEQRLHLQVRSRRVPWWDEVKPFKHVSLELSITEFAWICMLLLQIDPYSSLFYQLETIECNARLLNRKLNAQANAGAPHAPGLLALPSSPR